jgi:hypothetical protein
MTTRIAATIAAGFLAVGILVGSAGTLILRDAGAPVIADHMGDMGGMMAMMGGGSMSGTGSMMGPGSMMGTDSSLLPEDHRAHHAVPTPGASR